MSEPESPVGPDPSSAPVKTSTPSATAIFGILLSPAVAFFLLASLWWAENEARIIILMGGSILASVIAGIWSGYRLGLRLAPRNSLRIRVMLATCLLCVGACATLCFGGCLYGDRFSH